MHSLFSTHGSTLLPFFDQLLPTFAGMLGEGRPASHKQWALCIFDDLLEFASSVSVSAVVKSEHCVLPKPFRQSGPHTVYLWCHLASVYSPFSLMCIHTCICILVLCVFSGKNSWFLDRSRVFNSNLLVIVVWIHTSRIVTVIAVSLCTLILAS